MSKLGGKVIASQVDDITDLFLDDFLTEMVTELQRIEKIKDVSYKQSEKEQVVQNVLLAVADY